MHRRRCHINEGRDNKTAAEQDGGDYSSLDGMSLCERLKDEEPGAWRYVLEKVIDQEKRSPANNRRRADWGVSIESLLGRLYEEMVGQGKLSNYKGRGSLVGWLRSYLRGYLSRENPDDGRTTSMDVAKEVEDGEALSPLADRIAFEMSERDRRDAYGGEGDRVLRREMWDVARRCFRELWLGNSMQAYVMLLKTRFQMSSLEIKERLGVSSAANVDQMFSRAVKKMQEAKVKYGV